MFQLLQSVHPRDYISVFSINGATIPLPTISPFNTAYLLDASNSSVYSIISKELYSGDFLFIDAISTLFHNYEDLEELQYFLFNLNDVDFFLCTEYNEHTSFFFEENGDYYTSPIFPLTLRNSNGIRLATGLFFCISSYPIEFNRDNEFNSIMNYISNLSSSNPSIPLVNIYNQIT
jgi:hypothetical protein